MNYNTSIVLIAIATNKISYSYFSTKDTLSKGLPTHVYTLELIFSEKNVRYSGTKQQKHTKIDNLFGL